LNQTKRL